MIYVFLALLIFLINVLTVSIAKDIREYIDWRKQCSSKSTNTEKKP